MFDLIIRNGTIIDGTRTDRYPADIGLRADRIAAIGDLGDTESQHSIDAQGKIVAPGFVDVHNHSDGWLLQKPNFLPKTLQGFTTEVLMADGISYAPVDATTRAHWLYYMRALNGLMQSHYSGWESLADYMQLLDGRTAQNTITHLPYAHLRAMACGWDRRVPDDVQMEEILAGVERGMAEGAVGISTGLDYIAECFATTDELVEACTAMAAQQGIYATHVRYKKGTLAGVQEAVEIGRRAGVPVHISHFKGTSPQQIDELLSYVDQVAVNEVDFSFDVYPYLPGSTMLNFMLPYEVWEDGPLGVLPKLNDPAIRRRFARVLDRYANPLDRMTIAWLPGRDNARFIGRTIDEYVQQAGRTPDRRALRPADRGKLGGPPRLPPRRRRLGASLPVARKIHAGQRRDLLSRRRGSPAFIRIGRAPVGALRERPQALLARRRGVQAERPPGIAVWADTTGANRRGLLRGLSCL